MSRTKPNSKGDVEANVASQDPITKSALEEVLTLSEAAIFLRVTEADVLRMVNTQALPGRKIGEEWRFLRSGLKKWLNTSTGKKGILSHVGAIHDDPYAEEMLTDIYQNRKRSATQED